MATTPGGGLYGQLRRLRAAVRRARWPRQLSHVVADRLDSPLRRVAAGGVLLVLLAGTGVVASAGFGTATAEDTKLAGRPVPAGQIEAITRAAQSCPALTPARLAAQLMAASGFDANARTANGGTGVAGLTDAAWNKWKPRTSAQRADPAANITALAYLTCDLVGQVRQAGFGGDLWRLALAADHSGLGAVRRAKGVPQAASGYVERVAAYASWYGRRPGTATGSSGPTGSTGAIPNTGTAPAAVPDAYLAPVLAAGRTCRVLSPARVAAQLMAASGFNPNLLGAHGAQGIAGFTPQLWAGYAPSPNTTSPWDPSQAVPTLGLTMCRLSNELSALDKDSYRLALAAFRVGPDAVRQAGGVPDNAEIRAHLDLVTRYTAHYAQEPRLGGRPSGTPSPTTKPTVTPSPTPTGRPETGPGVVSPRPPKPGVTVTTAPPSSRPTTAPPKPNWQTRVVEATSVLTLGQSWSTNRLKFMLATDGNVLLYDQGKLVWQTRTGGKGAQRLVFQGDGNLGLYTASGATVWTSGTAGNNGAILVLQADGNVTISIGGQGRWHTGTAK